MIAENRLRVGDNSAEPLCASPNCCKCALIYGDGSSSCKQRHQEHHIEPLRCVMEMFEHSEPDITRWQDISARSEEHIVGSYGRPQTIESRNVHFRNRPTEKEYALVDRSTGKDAYLRRFPYAVPYNPLKKAQLFGFAAHKNNEKQQLEQPEEKQPRFWFFPNLKHWKLELSPDNLQVLSKKQQRFFSLALLKPCLPMSESSSVSFNTSDGNGVIWVGICYKNVVSQNDYQLQSYPDIGSGVYLQSGSGWIISHSRLEDNCMLMGSAKFRVGSIVNVEFDPYRGTVTYRANGKSFVQQTSIGIKTSQPVHFCVSLNGKLRAGIIDV